MTELNSYQRRLLKYAKKVRYFDDKQDTKLELFAKRNKKTLQKVVNDLEDAIITRGTEMLNKIEKRA